MNFKDLINKVNNNITEDIDAEEMEAGLEMTELFDTLAEELDNNQVGLALIDVLEQVYNNSDENVKDVITESIFDVFEDDSLDGVVHEDELDEKKKIKISKIDKLTRKKDYRRNKQKIKKASRLMRKTSKFKKSQKKKKRMNKRGLTGSGKRIVSYI